MIDRYTYSPIAQIWSDQNKYLLWMQIELTFLKHFKDVDIPLSNEFRDEWIIQIQGIEHYRKHDVASFVEWLEGYVKEHDPVNARYVHYGLTSSDILDTTFTLQIRESNLILKKLCDDVFHQLNGIAEKYRNLEMTGRTHGQAAEVICFGNKFLSYANLFADFGPSEPHYGKLSGSVGDYKYFRSTISYNVLADLGLTQTDLIDGQIINRAYYAKFMNEWAVLASIIAKIATDIRLLSQSEVGEIQEGFSANQIGSSSMPHKRNPIYSENLCGLARTIRGYQTTVMQNIELWNERDISHSSAERIVFPDAAILLGFMLERFKTIIENICVNEDKIKENLAKHSQYMKSQGKMLKLIDEGYSRKEAHERIKGDRD